MAWIKKAIKTSGKILLSFCKGSTSMNLANVYSFLTSSLKITSGEFSADEQQGRAEAKQRNITDKKLSRQSAHQKQLQSLQK